MPRKHCVWFVVLVVAAAAAHADVIYEQPPLACDEWVMGYFPSDLSLETPPGSAQALDDFTLGASSSLTDIHWWGVGGSEQADDFTVRIYSGSWDNPTLIAELTPDNVTRQTTSYTEALPGNLELDVWAYGFQLDTPIALDGDVPYYISIVNNTVGGADWAWTFGNGSNHVAGIRTNDSDQWSKVPYVDLSYTLTGTVVPEPATLTLLVLGIAGFVVKAATRSALS